MELKLDLTPDEILRGFKEYLSSITNSKNDNNDVSSKQFWNELKKTKIFEKYHGYSSQSQAWKYWLKQL